MQFASRDGLAAPRLDRAHVAPPGQALVQIGVADAGQRGQFRAPFGSDWSLHVGDGSESLPDAQAIRYVRSASASLDNAGMETASARRRRKLDHLIEQHGLPALAAAAKVNPAYLAQIKHGVLLPPKVDGSRSPRALGDAAARAIETALGLEAGWFDAPDNDIEQFDADTLLFAGFYQGMSGEERATLRELCRVAMRKNPGVPAIGERRTHYVQVKRGRRAGDLAPAKKGAKT